MSESVCGGLLSQQTGVVNSPNYPNNYSNNQRCDWVVQVEPMSVIMVDFMNVDIENNPICDKDFIEVKKEGWLFDLMMQ